MTQRRVVSRDEWETARAELLVKEKELTRARDALSARRRRLPMVRIDKEYVFESPDGAVAFRACSAAVVSSSSGTSCSTATGTRVASAVPYRSTTSATRLTCGARDTRLVLVSRAPLTRIEPFRRRMGWTYNYLDLTALGRQEEELEYPQQWWRHHDRYDDRHHRTGHRDRMPARVVGHPTELEQH